MIRPTYRFLENHLRIGPLGLAQWFQLVLAVALLWGVVELLGIPTKPALSFGVFVIGVPAAVAAASDEFDFSVGRQVRDAFSWRFQTRAFEPVRDPKPASLSIEAGES